jgi:hypothetical protein
MHKDIQQAMDDDINNNLEYLNQLKSSISACFNNDGKCETINQETLNNVINNIFNHVTLHKKYFSAKIALIDQQVQYITKKCDFLEKKNEFLIEQLIKSKEEEDNKKDDNTEYEQEEEQEEQEEGQEEEQEEELDKENKEKKQIKSHEFEMYLNNFGDDSGQENEARHDDIQEHIEQNQGIIIIPKFTVDDLIKETLAQEEAKSHNLNKRNRSCTADRPRIERSNNRIKVKRIYQTGEQCHSDDDNSMLNLFQNIINPSSSKYKKMKYADKLFDVGKASLATVEEKDSKESNEVKCIPVSDVLHDGLSFVECDFSVLKLEDILNHCKIMDDIKLENEKNGYVTEFENAEYQDYYLYYDKKYGINFEKLAKVREPVTKLINVIGMTDLKNKILNIIAARLFPGYNKPKPLHTLIMGNPGLGKTKVCRIIVDIYCGLGLADNNKIVYANRAQLVGKHLGHTAPQTQKMIDEAIGGILVIDEAYALGDDESKDTFSKECINTIVQAMSENKKKFIMIMIGYENLIKSNLFKCNDGLESRFSSRSRFVINDYTASELANIFLAYVKKHDFVIHDASEKTINKLFVENFKCFPGFGRSIKDYFNDCVATHYRNLLGKDPRKSKNLLSINTLKECIKTLKDISQDSNFVSTYHQ